MTSSLTRPQTRALLYRRIAGLGSTGTADSMTVTTLTDPFVFQDSNRGSNRNRGVYIYRPSLTGDDRVKRIKSVSGAVVTHSGSNWSDTTTYPYELVGPMHPDELDAAIGRATKRVFFPARAAVSLWPDIDVSGTTGWTGVDCAATKGTTAGTQVESGIRSLIGTNSGAGGYLWPTAIRVTPGDVLYNATRSRVNAAGQTAIFRLWDVTNDAEIGTAISHSELAWQHLWRVDTVPAGCYQVTLHLEGAGASDVCIWDCLPSHRLYDARLTPVSWVDEPFKVIDLEVASYGRNLASGRDLAASCEYVTLRRGRDYTVEAGWPLANPYTIQMHSDPTRNVQDKVPQADLWVYGYRPFSDITDLSDESEITNAPENYLLAACEYEIADVLKDRYRDEPRWAQLRAEAEAELLKQIIARPVEPEPIEAIDYSWGLR